MRKSWIQLYAPFIALAALQAVIIVAAPSRSSDGPEVSTLGPLGADEQLEGGAYDPATGAAVDPATGAPVDTSGGTSGGTDGGGTTGGTTDGGGTTGGVAGDTSHCKGDRQHDVIFNAPPCRPKFVGDNGGATYRGVTAKEILVVNFSCQPDEQVNAILATQGLASSEAESRAMEAAVVKVLNERLELYGRKIVVKRHRGQCKTGSPDPALIRQDAAEVVKMNPFMVIGIALGAEPFDVWARNGVPSIGGTNFDVSFYAGRRPYRWDVFPTGTEAASVIGEYYCKKLAKGTADHAGVLIHQSIGGRNTPRKLGIVYPNDGNGSTPPNAKRLVDMVRACGGRAADPWEYQSDIARAQEQTDATIAYLIDQKVTTVVCFCDPIAPVFMTAGATKNRYYPEHLLPSANLLDYDVLGRLYEPSQWNHAFGPSQLTKPVPHAQSDASRYWRAAGNSGTPCAACNLITGYLSLMGTMLQEAGPNLNPLTVERGLVGARLHRGGWIESKGDPGVYLISFGPNDYNAISDFREVYWDATATSTIDNKKGAYVDMNGGRRYEPGKNQLDSRLTVPVKPS